MGMNRLLDGVVLSLIFHISHGLVPPPQDSGFRSSLRHLGNGGNATVWRQRLGVTFKDTLLEMKTFRMDGVHEPHGHESHESHSTPLEQPHSGKVIVLQFGVSIILLALSFAMANSGNETLRNYTWHTLDNIISIFLAVLVFQVMDEVLVDAGIMPAEVASLGSICYAFACLMLALLLSSALKNDRTDLAIFAAASAHFVSFAFMHSVLVTSEHYGRTLVNAGLVFVILCFALPAVYFVSHHFKRQLGLNNDPEVVEKLEDLEDDAGAMGLAICWTLLVCYAICGEFQDVEESEEAEDGERRLMLTYAIILTVGAFAFLGFTSNRIPDDYYEKRAFSIFSSFLAMCVAWAYLLWGKWQFHDHHYSHVPVFGRIVFASVASFVSMAIIVAMAVFVDRGSIRRHTENGHLLILTALGLLVAWSWEEVFDKSIEVLSEDVEDSWHRAELKIGTTALLLGVVLPVHVMYFKPIVLKIQEGEEGEGESSARSPKQAATKKPMRYERV